MTSQASYPRHQYQASVATAGDKITINERAKPNTASIIIQFANPRLIASLVIVTILSVRGFGILLPNEIRVFRQRLSGTSDIPKIARLGMTNARLGGIQGVLHLAVIFIMANVRV